RVAHRAARASDASAGTRRSPGSGRVMMLKALVPNTQDRRGSPRRLDEGGRYLGIPPRTRLSHPTRARGSSSPRLARCPRNRVRYTGISLRTPACAPIPVKVIVGGSPIEIVVVIAVDFGIVMVGPPAPLGEAAAYAV